MNTKLDFINGNTKKCLLAMTLPMIVAMFLNMAYNLVDSVYCKIELPKVANGNWRMLHLQIGESCKAFARSSQERCNA